MECHDHRSCKRRCLLDEGRDRPIRESGAICCLEGPCGVRCKRGSTIEETFESLEFSRTTLWRRTRFKVENVVKGDIAPGDVVVVVGTPGGCSCVATFVPGRKYRLLATVSDSDADELILRFCDYIVEVE